MQRLSNDVGPGSAFKDRQCLDFCRDANRSEGCRPHGAEKSDESTDRKDERERYYMHGARSGKVQRRMSAPDVYWGLSPR